MENASLELLKPVPGDRLAAWLKEFYGKPVTITKREVLRHRDLSFVERLFIQDSLPESLVYKLVLPPWDVEQDLHEHVLIPSISNSAQLYLSSHYGKLTALFLEDLGSHSLKDNSDKDLAIRVGQELAKVHRAYSYRIDELDQTGVLRTLYPIDYEDFTRELAQRLLNWQLISKEQAADLSLMANLLATKLVGEPISLVHGDLYAENLILQHTRLYIIDWSWFTMLGVPTMDLATLTMEHTKNGSFSRWREEVIDAYCFESGRRSEDVLAVLPVAETLSRLLFLHWLAERRTRGILGTTIGPVDEVIPKIVSELVVERLPSLRG